MGNLFEAIKPGARIWIIDLDMEHYTCQPPHPAFDLIKRLIRQFCNTHGRNFNIGRQLISILKNAGFTSITQDIEPLNTDTVKMPLLQKFIMQEVDAYQAALQYPLSNDEMAMIANFIGDLPHSKTFLNYGVTMISALKPHARLDL